ncbi:MAG: hypothetical protein KJ905_00395 [Nanoarchaeota archaeon]|nr:hypothetical protein [Nanoarchaeota archaeon]MBU1501219.1 hypothetical protein [Nanoarchaeota archaeon]MBU2459070.1 hypothetical protein [Nanoarchaeota archaeon]
MWEYVALGLGASVWVNIVAVKYSEVSTWRRLMSEDIVGGEIRYDPFENGNRVESFVVKSGRIGTKGLEDSLD